MIINEATRDYICQHENEDVRKLALQGTKGTDIDLSMALQQIAGRQTARRKLPSWAAVEGITYPPHLNMEQCSSEQTARYKSSLIPTLFPSANEGNGVFADLTGGLGIDFYWMSQDFKKRIYVEQNEQLCAMAEHNFRLLGLESSVCCCDAATYLTQMEAADVIFLDPARRNEHGGRTYGIADCTPNVLELLPLLMEKSRCVILKLSPMLDWRKAVEDIQKPMAIGQKPLAYVNEVHIVSVNNECKELLLVLNKEQHGSLHITCINNDDRFEVLSTGEKKISTAEKTEKAYLYEPNASIMKAGCFEEVEERFAVCQIAPNSHLFTSPIEITCFPGRKFQISAISSMNKQELRQTLTDVERANITVRNFPLTADALRKKLKIKDGGDTYIFGTTLADGQHKLYICRKIG